MMTPEEIEKQVARTLYNAALAKMIDATRAWLASIESVSMAGILIGLDAETPDVPETEAAVVTCRGLIAQAAQAMPGVIELLPPTRKV